MQKAAATKLASRPLNVSQEQVDANAIDVITNLKNAGFQAWLVGGCVRDLLLGAAPKDFDVATSATPEQVRRLFRRALMIGRRFKIAHVRYGRDIIEVSTFRKAPTAAAVNGSGRGDGAILHDNVYGTLDEDAFRRDFTVNALYYDPHEEEILDYVGGIEDIRKRRLRFIGNAQQRLLEDPVRLLRAFRFQAKLGFDLDPAITEDLENMALRLRLIPSARLFDEFGKMFLGGYGARVWRQLEQTPIAKALFPSLPANSHLVRLAIANTDKRIAQGRSATSGFLLSVMLWKDYQAKAEELSSPAGGGMSIGEANTLAASEALAVQRRTLALPRRHTGFITEVWQLQPLLQKRLKKRVMKALQHPKFRAAYDFLLLRAAADEVDAKIADWWTRIQQVSKDERAKMIAALDKPSRKRTGAAKRRARPKAAEPTALSG